MRSTMMDVPLTVTSIMRYGTTAFRGQEVVTSTGDGTRRRSFADLARRAARLAHALRPERWAYIDEVPKTSVGKFSKRMMREAYAQGEYKVIQVG